MASSDMWTDLITPVELTGYARAALEDYERQINGSLARWLPNRTIPDITARFQVGATGLRPVAEFMSYDTESPFASMPGAQRVTIELPKIGLKYRISEYDQLRLRGDLSQTVLRPSVLSTTEMLVNAISDRFEYERGYALEFAELLIDDETGFTQTGDWGRDASHEVVASPLWTNPSTATPIDDMIEWRDQYIATNGFPPGSILTSTAVATNLQRTAEMRNLFSSLVGSPSIITRDAVNAVLGSHGLPGLVTYDRQVNLRGSVVKVLSPEFLFMLPTPGGSIGGVQLGATYWGETLEAGEPEYQIQPMDRPGIVAGVWKTRDPIGLFVHGTAIGLAVLGDANLSLRAQVMPQTS